MQQREVSSLPVHPKMHVGRNLSTSRYLTSIKSQLAAEHKSIASGIAATHRNNDQSYSSKQVR